MSCKSRETDKDSTPPAWRARRVRCNQRLMFAAAAVLPGAVFAQQVPASQQTANGIQLDEIVVTAQKYAQRLQDVPLSVAAVTGDEIRARGATSLEDLQYSIPDLSAFQYGPGVEFIQIRGIAGNVGGPTVGQYVDEMAISGTNAYSRYTPDIRLLDMDRIEVLRGPQGTLYGEGSIGGTVRYVTASPSLTEFSGSVEGEGDSISEGGSSYRVNGVLSLPLVQDYLGLRLVGGYERDGGWIDNTTTGLANVNGSDIKTFRAKLLFQPVGELQASLLVLHQDIDQNQQNFGIGGQTNATVDTVNESHYNLVNGVLTYDFGPALLTESAGYLDSRLLDEFDLTPFYLPVLAPIFGLSPGFITQIGYPATDATLTWNDELRLSPQGQGPFHWTVGGFFQKSDTTSDSATYTAPGALPLTILSDFAASRSSAFSVFGEASYQITQQLDALVGLRYYRDRETLISDSDSLGFPAHDSGAAVFHTVNPRFNLGYAFSPESMVYFNAAKGFRSGGFNLTSAGMGVYPIPPTYAPDSLWSYEVGTKQQLLDRKLELTAAVYYNDWQNVQSNFFAPGSPVEVVENGGKVTGWGTDLGLTARPLPGLTVTASYGWNNLAYRTDTADKSIGDPVDNAVRESYSASLEYRRHVFGSTNGLVRVDYQHAGDAQNTLRNFNDQIVRLPDHTIVNGRLGLDFGRYEVAVVGANLFNDRHVIIPGPYGVLTENLEQRPRMVGVNVTARF